MIPKNNTTYVNKVMKIDSSDKNTLKIDFWYVNKFPKGKIS